MKITERQLRKTIRKAILESHMDMQRAIGHEIDREDRELGYPLSDMANSMDDTARRLELDRTDALLGAALETETRNPEIQYVGRDPHAGTDVYLSSDGTYIAQLDGDFFDGLSEEDLVAVLDGRY